MEIITIILWLLLQFAIGAIIALLIISLVHIDELLEAIILFFEAVEPSPAERPEFPPDSPIQYWKIDPNAIISPNHLDEGAYIGPFKN